MTQREERLRALERGIPKLGQMQRELAMMLQETEKIQLVLRV
jgi:hypothetical protein